MSPTPQAQTKARPKRERIGRQRLSIRQQHDIAERLYKNEKQSDLAREYGVGRQAISHLKHRSSFKRCALTVTYPSKAVDLALLTWLRWVSEQAGSLNVTGDVLRHKAKAIALVQGNTKFQGTSGWLAQWSPELLAILADIRRQIEDARPALACVWNIDEASLFFKALSTRFFAVRHARKKSVSVAKDRITVTCAVSGTGEKFALQVINKSKKPQGMRPGCKLKEYNCHFDSSKKALQTANTFASYVDKFNALAELRDVTFFVLVDNASSRLKAIKTLGALDDQTPPNWYKSVVFLLLPPNATSVLQPVDMGVLRSLKARFRRIQLAPLFAAFEKVVDSGGKEQFDVTKATHLSHCLDWLAAAWDEVPANLIRRCWAKAAVL
ncbi:tigger transposable element-derived protein 6-like, partial [Achlya hypogyna]